jgi:hypothetical protein
MDKECVAIRDPHHPSGASSHREIPLVFLFSDDFLSHIFFFFFFFFFFAFTNAGGCRTCWWMDPARSFSQE